MDNNLNKPSYNEACKIFDIVNTYLCKVRDDGWEWDEAVEYIQEHWNDAKFNYDYKEAIDIIKVKWGDLY